MTTKFLIIDDDPFICDLLSSFFKITYDDARVESAGTNKKAFHIMENYIPDLITTDLMRPGGDPLDFILQIRKDPKLWHIPVIGISGAIKSDAMELKLYRNGFNGVIRKPFGIKVLVEALNKVNRARPKADPDSIMIHAGFESQSLDYKESIDIKTKKGKASIAKDVIAFANYGGGTIIVGVKEDPPGFFTANGVEPSIIGDFETTHLNQAVNSYLDPPINVKVRKVENEGKIFIFVEIPPAENTFILAAKKNEAASLFTGRIYTRTTNVTSEEIQTSEEMRTLFNRFVKTTGTTLDM